MRLWSRIFLVLTPDGRWERVRHESLSQAVLTAATRLDTDGIYACEGQYFDCWKDPATGRFVAACNSYDSNS